MGRVRWSDLAFGSVALGGAAWLFASGNGWLGCWLVVLSLTMFTRQPMRTFWTRLDGSDPAATAIHAMAVSLIFIVATVALMVMEFTGVGLRKDDTRGTLDVFVLALFGAAFGLALRQFRHVRHPPKSPFRSLEDL